MMRRHQTQLETGAGDEELGSGHKEERGKMRVAGIDQGEIRLNTSKQERK